MGEADKIFKTAKKMREPRESEAENFRVLFLEEIEADAVGVPILIFFFIIGNSVYYIKSRVLVV